MSLPLSRRLALSGLLSAPALLSRPLRAQAAASGTLKVAVNVDLKSLDPIFTSAYVTRDYGFMVYDTLLALDETLEPRPQMVEGWNISPDKLRYTFTLRPGLNWHDGTPVTAEDCVASLRRWGARDGMGQKLMEATASLEAPDAWSIVLTLKQPYGLVLRSLAKIATNVPFMMPKRVAETSPFTEIRESIGSGPFIFQRDEWVPGHKAVFRRNPGYRPREDAPRWAAGAKRVMVDRVEWYTMPEGATATNALLTGEIDYVGLAPIDLLPLLKRSSDVEVAVLDKLGVQGMIRMNHLQSPFDNIKARQALLHTIDQKAYLDAAIGDPEYWFTCHSFYTCNAPIGTNAGAEPYLKPDLDKARTLFKEAGYDGRPVVVMDPTDMPQLHAAALVTADALGKVGLTVDQQAMDWGTLVSRRSNQGPIDKGGWNIFFTYTVGPDLLEPFVLAMSTGCGDKSWAGWPCDPKMEELRTAYTREADPAKQRALTTEIQRYDYEHVVTHGVFGSWYNPVAYRRSLTGLVPAPVPLFWNISKPT
ncbi:ABC transporter substrate-binding protein [Roseomonas mucosa]